jgi:pilus assembly protein CpaB
MRRQTLIALAVALILGLIAVYLTNTFLVASDQQEQSGKLTRVAVAAVPLDYGQQLTPETIRFVDYPAASVPIGAFTNPSQLIQPGKRRIALMNIAPNEPILSSKITGEGQRASISALLPDGMRAASVRINDVSGVSGFVQPNDTVDVLITRVIAGDRQVTDMLLQGVRVIAMGQRSENADGKPALASTATLQVDPLAAQKLALAQEIGSLSLVLRKPGELNAPIVPTISLDDLRYGRTARYYPQAMPRATRTAAPARPQPRPAVPAPVRRKPPAPAPRTTNNVEVVRGTASTNYEVGRYGS